MTARWVCTNPEHPGDKHARYYDSTTDDGYCPDREWGTGLLVSVDDWDTARGNLFILVCDVSAAMRQSGPFAGVGNALAAVARGLAHGPGRIKHTETTWLTIVPFAGRAMQLRDAVGRPFLRTVADLRDEFPRSEALAAHLLARLLVAVPDLDDRYADLNRALAFARGIHEAALAGDLRAFGLPRRFALRQEYWADKTVPAIRTILVARAWHRPADGSPLRPSPWAGDAVPTLLTMHVGSDNEAEWADLRQLAHPCLVHQMPGCFIVRGRREDDERLGQIFRLGLRARILCPVCMAEAEKGYQPHSPAVGAGG